MAYALTPALCGLAKIRLKQGKELPARYRERFGESQQYRPEGKLIWIHAASNGEALSALPLIEKLASLPSAPHILITTMTVTAAKLIEQRCDAEHVTHQFISYDHPIWIKRFHNHWRPDCVLWIESELWPNHLSAIAKRKIPAALLNMRLSETSRQRWSMAKQTFQKLLSAFDIIATQSEKDLTTIQSLGVDKAVYKGNLKEAAHPLPYDPLALEDLKDMIGQRPVMLYASTHAPEEAMAVRLHEKLKSDIPDLLTIIIPRHPKRGTELAEIFNNEDSTVALRSLKMSPRKATEIYIADTLGELGVFFTLCPVVFMGNSLNVMPGGGHNLLEPAWFDCAIISGDDLANFSILKREMPIAKACELVKNEEELYKTALYLLKDKIEREILAKNAHDYVASKQAGSLDSIWQVIEPTCKKAGLL